MSSPAVSGHRRRSRDWLHMDDTVATSDPPAAGFRRVAMPVLVDGEIMHYEFDYQSPRRDYDDMDYLWRRSLEREELTRVTHVRDRKRARAAAASSDDAIRRCLREARAGDAGMPEECAVCLQDFDADAKETLRVMPSCSHAFHPDCIFRWLRVKTLCPLCRQDLPPQKHKDQDFDDEDDSDEDSDEDDTDSDTDSDEDDTDGVDYQEESTPAVPGPEEP